MELIGNRRRFYFDAISAILRPPGCWLPRRRLLLQNVSRKLLEGVTRGCFLAMLEVS